VFQKRCENFGTLILLVTRGTFGVISVFVMLLECQQMTAISNYQLYCQSKSKTVIIISPQSRNAGDPHCNSIVIRGTPLQPVATPDRHCNCLGVPVMRVLSRRTTSSSEWTKKTLTQLQCFARVSIEATSSLTSGMPAVILDFLQLQRILRS